MEVTAEQAKGMKVGVFVGVKVGVVVAVFEGVPVGVWVAVTVGVLVTLPVAVEVAVLAGVLVGSGMMQQLLFQTQGAPVVACVKSQTWFWKEVIPPDICFVEL